MIDMQICGNFDGWIQRGHAARVAEKLVHDNMPLDFESIRQWLFLMGLTTEKKAARVAAQVRHVLREGSL